MILKKIGFFYTTKKCSLQLIKINGLRKVYKLNHLRKGEYKMSNVVKQDWVDNLLEGDLVAIDVGSYYSTDYIITKISRITPKRLIKTESGHTFNNKGWERGKNSTWDRRTYLQPVTPKIEEHIEKNQLLKKIKEVKYEVLPLDVLRKMYTLLNESCDEKTQ